MGEVVSMAALSRLRTPQERVDYLIALAPKNTAGLVPITTMRQALAWGDIWESAYHSLECAHTLALEQLRASEILLRLANEELERLRKLTA